jgi:thiosulfate dehydrogenase
LKLFIGGLILGLLIVPIVVYMYFALGIAPVATSASPMLFEQALAHSALHARIGKEMPKAVPVSADEANYLAGAEVYKQNCAVCHGLPLQTQSAISRGMYPTPPQLFQGKGVTDDEPGETYWKVSNGIRLTGMPGFSQSLSSTQMWQVSLLLANADKLPDSAKTALVTTAAPAVTAPPAPIAAPSGQVHP